jgi:hypothetical protein
MTLRAVLVGVLTIGCGIAIRLREDAGFGCEVVLIISMGGGGGAERSFKSSNT